MQTIQLPLSEYENLKEQVALLKDADFMKKVNKLVDLLVEEKYGLYMKDDTDDLTECSLNQSWPDEKSPWDEV